MLERQAADFDETLRTTVMVAPASPERVDAMWEQIARQSARKTTGAGRRMNPRSIWAGSRIFRWGFSLILILILLGILFRTPVGRVLAERIAAFFTYTESSEKPIPTLPNLVNPPQSGAAQAPVPSATVAFEQPVRVEVALKEPQVLPPGYQFSYALYTPEKKQAMFAYIYQPSLSGEMFTLSLSPALDADEVGANARVENIVINGLNANMVQGGWMVLAGETHETWDPNVPVRTLRWFDGEIYLKLQFHWNEPSSPAALSFAQMLQVAESIQPTKRYETRSIPFASSQNYTEMESQFGYDLLEPGFLPAGYQLVRLEQVPAGRPEVIAQYYPAATTQENGPHLSIYQAPRSVGEEIKPYLRDPVERVEIAGIQGRFMLGAEDGSGIFPTWWLFWETPDLKLSIYFYPGTGVSAEDAKATMIEIAKSMK